MQIREKLRVIFFEGGEYGGSVKSLAEMARGLAGLGCEISLFSQYRQTGPEDLGSLDFIREKYFLDQPPEVRPRPDVTSRSLGIPYLSRFGWRYLYLAFCAMRRSKPHVIYLNNGPGEHLPVVLAARMLGIPVVSHLRGTWCFSPPDRFCVPLVCRYIALTQYGTLFFHEQGIPMSKLTQVYNPFDVAEFDRRSMCSTKALLAEGSAIRVVQVGTLRKHKRPDLAIEAFLLAKKVVPNLKLILAGSGPMRDALEQRVRGRRIADSILFTGPCESIPALLRQCHIGLLLSRSEGQPNSVMEYMAAGLPVVATAIGGIDELVTHNQSGLIVSAPSPEEISACIVKLCDSPEMRVSMGTAGRRKITSSVFSPGLHLQAIYEMLQEIAHQKRAYGWRAHQRRETREMAGNHCCCRSRGVSL
ncbi:MAG: glycosyltransferase family 4 protein [Sedimentisphaerales bacterium]|jgi:glycosyltransferase involved in cell wall biosynthesis|nr:glycosyltransferase family 4 protein [Sedimentisphaerales bacterium]